MVKNLSPEEHQFYMQQLMDNYRKPKNYSKLSDYTFFFHKKNPSCGDVFDIFVKIDDNGKISSVGYTGEGCAISTASFSLLSQKLVGMDFKEACKLSEEDVYELLGVSISPGKINCAMLSLNCFLEGAEKFEKEKE